MKRSFCKRSVIIIFLAIAVPQWIKAQSDATVQEFSKNYTTYPFSDPDPIANDGKIYPYFRYDGFTDKSVQKSWKIVELENDYIKVQIMPEIGGKIWTAIDKKNGKPFLYNNEVVKFRDIAMRGPWTSGGIEANFGIIGHTPAVATPVDYITQKNSDGSVSCFISNLDLLTSSRWVLEVRLPKDKAYFITHVRWHNTSATIQPYYSWMNLAVKVTDSLHFIDPGTHYIGHDGEPDSWPIDSVNQKDLSVYGQNNFGGAKSYHIFGTYSKYFGAYWPEENFGMIHYAEREDKLGRKVFLWALSDAGKIWEKLLTDKSGQYAEIQSGRLFNQNTFKSSHTPFKQRGFTPYQSDEWSEYWYPFSNTNGVGIADLNGVTDVQIQNNSLSINISPVSKIADTLFVYDKNGQIIYNEKVNLQPLQPFSKAIELKSGQTFGKIRLAGTVIKANDEKNKELDRPSDAYRDFDWNSVYGLYLLGRDAANHRTYTASEDYIRRSLEKESSFAPAIVQMATLQYRKMNYDSAFYFAKKALSIDTYDPEGNFFYGLAAKHLGKFYDALDGFEVASLSIAFRSAAFTEMSKMYFEKGDYDQAYEYASRSLENNIDNTTSLQLQLVAARLMNKTQDAKRIKEDLLEIDPLNHLVAFEDFWKTKDENSKNAFTHAIKNELPGETFLELAIWYYNINRIEESKAILDLAPQNNKIQYWEAFLNKESADSRQKLETADKGDPLMVFPFREETAEVLKWAIENTQDWKPRYYLALIESFRNNESAAKELLENIPADVDFAPLYIRRGLMYDSGEKEKQLADFNKALSLDKEEWRYRKYLAEYFLKNKENEKALETVESFYKAHPDNFIIGMLYTRALILTKKYAAAEKVLAKINILPYEGATNGHNLYRQTKLMLALEALEKRDFKTALKKVQEAKEWPMNLGEGMPFPGSVKTQLEDELTDLIRQAMKDKNLKIDYEKYTERIKAGNRRSE
jgi:Tfp pilus assembly protein PilF